ncbi:hypothetical protein VZ94_02255 [Methylocucumis oryzae]|uniref:Uncharacterized protein n=1 Tax=Methylocucumis oryzae TaxID=1632867 RepID=A0A0F3IMQ2_9GAMM|nr:hypothetical protein VZ94_02255 [Methylocucumis oryzae]
MKAVFAMFLIQEKSFKLIAITHIARHYNKWQITRRSCLIKVMLFRRDNALSLLKLIAFNKQMGYQLKAGQI